MSASQAGRLTNPYVGPIPFLEGQTLYGRKRETVALADLLIAKRVVLLFSPSGAGKTSLIQSALLPRLRPRLNLLPIVRLDRKPTPEDGNANRYVLSALRTLEGRFLLADRLPVDALRGLSLREYLRKRQSLSAKERTPSLLVLDQCEELFTLNRFDWSEKRGFLHQLGEALGRSGAAIGEGPVGEDADEAPRLWALLSMREDHVAEIEPFVELLPTSLAFRYRLEPLEVEAAVEAVTMPALEGFDKAYFVEAAARRLVDDLRSVRAPGPSGEWISKQGRFVEPVHLQVVCQRLWDEVVVTEGRPIDVGDVAPSSRKGELDEVQEALAAFYDKKVEAAACGGRVCERRVRDWIERELITATGVRTKALLEPGVLPLEGEALTALVNDHVLRLDVEGDRRWLELSHDRLVNPVLQSNDGWRKRHLALFQQQARIWVEAGKHQELLFSADALDEAEEFVREHPEEIGDDDQEFLQESRKERERIQEEKRKGQEIAKANATLRKQRRWLALVTILVALTTVVMTAMAAFLETSNRRLEEAQQTTLEARREGLFYALAHESREWSERGLPLESARLLAVQAWRFATAMRRPSSQAALLRFRRDATLYDLATEIAHVTSVSGYRPHRIPNIVATAASGDRSGMLLATASADGVVHLWRKDGEEYREAGTWVPNAGRSIGWLALEGEGRWLASTTEGTGRGGDLWFAAIDGASNITPEPAALQLGVTAVALSSRQDEDSPIFVTGDADGKVRILTRRGDGGGWDGHDLGRRIGEVNAVAVGPRKALVAAGAYGAVMLWGGVDWQTGQAQEACEIAGHDLRFRIRSLVLSDDEDTLWSAGGVLAEGPQGSTGAEPQASNGGLLEWDLSGGVAAPAHRTYLTGEFISRLALIEGGKAVAAATLYSGRLLRLDLAARERGMKPVDAVDEVERAGIRTVFGGGTGVDFITLGRGGGVRLWIPPVKDCSGGASLGSWRIGKGASLRIAGSGEWTVIAGAWRGRGALQLVRFEEDGLAVADPKVDCIVPAMLEIEPRHPGGRSEPTSLAVDGQRRLVAAGTYDGRVLVYRLEPADAGAGLRLVPLAEARQPAASLVFLSDEDCLLAGRTGGISILALREGRLEEVGTLAVPWKGRVDLLESSSEWIAAGTRARGSISIWARRRPPTADLSCGLEARELQQQQLGGNASALAFSPDGRYLAETLDDGASRLWTTGDWAEQVLDTRPAGGSAVGFSPDGRLLAAGYLDGTVGLWRLGGEAGAELAMERQTHKGRRVAYVGFVSDGRVVVSAGFDDRLRTTPTLPALMDRLCSLARRNMSRAEWDDLVGQGMPYECTCGQFEPGPDAPASKSPTN